MTQDKTLLQIRNGVYLLCGISLITLVVSVGLNLHLTNRSLAEMKGMASTASSEQALINELNGLLEANQIDALKARCGEILAEKPLSRTGHFYLGVAHYHAGDRVQSRKHLEEALRIDPAWHEGIAPYLEKL